MKAKEYNLIVQCVESGVRLGWNRAHKHEEHPESESIQQAIQNAVMNEICEWFDFDGESKNE